MKLQAYYENKKHFASALTTPYLLRSNLQFFSDPGGDGGEGGDGGNGAAGDGGAAGTGTEGGDGGESKLSFTQEEYDKKLQEGIATELEKQKETWRKELEETMKKERKEAEELAKLSAEERAKVEQEKAKLKLDEEKAALDKEKLDFQREKLFLQTEKILSEEKLDTRLAPFLIGEDADSTHNNIKLYKEVHKEAVQNEVADVLKGKKQLVGGGSNLSEIEQLEQQRQEALKNRNMAEAISLKNQIFALQQK